MSSLRVSCFVLGTFFCSLGCWGEEWDSLSTKLQANRARVLHLEYSATVEVGEQVLPNFGGVSSSKSPKNVPEAELSLEFSFWLDFANMRLRKDNSRRLFNLDEGKYVKNFDSVVLNENKIWISQPPSKNEGQLYHFEIGDVLSTFLLSDAVDYPVFAAFGVSSLHRPPAVMGREAGVEVTRLGDSKLLVSTIVGSGSRWEAKKEVVYNSLGLVESTRLIDRGELRMECIVESLEDVAGISVPATWTYTKFLMDKVAERGVVKLVGSGVVRESELNEIFSTSIPIGGVVLDHSDRGIKKVDETGGLVKYEPGQRVSGVLTGLRIAVVWLIAVGLVAIVFVFLKKRKRGSK